jgi:hypothetical protein
MNAKHKRHRRPQDALDPTPPLFKDLPRLIYCPRKEHYRPATDFGRNRRRPSGLQPYCKTCRRDDARKDRAKPKSDRRLIKATIRKLDKLINVLRGNTCEIDKQTAAAAIKAGLEEGYRCAVIHHDSGRQAGILAALEYVQKALRARNAPLNTPSAR